MKKNKITSNLFSIMYLSYSFGYILIPETINEIILVFSILALLLTSIKRKVIFNIKIFLMTLFIIIQIIGLLYTTNVNGGMTFLTSLIILLLIMIFNTNSNESIKISLKYIFLFSLFASLSVVLHPIIPNLLSNIRNSFTTDSNLVILNNIDMTKGMYGGIFPDRASAAFYASLLILLSSSEFITAKKSGSLVFLAIGITSLLLTGKRGPLIAVLLSLVIIVFFFNPKKISKKHTVLLFFSISLMIITMLLTGIGDKIISSFFTNDDLSSGRFDIYITLFKDFIRKPMMGFGTRSTIVDLGIGGHNDYLTILRDNGIIGFVVYLLLLSTMVIECIKVKSMTTFNVFKFLLLFFFLSYSFVGNPLFDVYIVFIVFYVVAPNNNLNRSQQ